MIYVMDLFDDCQRSAFMKRLLALGLAISLGGCAYSPSYWYYGYYRPYGYPVRAASGSELSATGSKLSITASGG